MPSVGDNTGHPSLSGGGGCRPRRVAADCCQNVQNKPKKLAPECQVGPKTPLPGRQRRIGRPAADRQRGTASRCRLICFPALA